MKKFLFLLFCSIFLLSCESVNKLSNLKKLDEDLKEFSFFIQQGYVNYDYLVENENFDIKKICRQVKSDYIKEQGLYKDINVSFLGERLAWYVYKGMGDFRDEHLTGVAGRNSGSYNYHFFLYFSNQYFKKEDNDFILFKTDSDELHTGMKYTGDSSLLHRYFLEDELVYRYAFISLKNPELKQISLDDKLYSIDMEMDNKSSFINRGSSFGYIETEKNIYISIEHFSPSVDETQQEYEDKLSKIIFKQYFSDVNKNVILDLRGNSGGYDSYFEAIILAVLYKKKPDDNILYKANMEKAYQGKKYLTTPLTTEVPSFTAPNYKELYIKARNNKTRSYSNLKEPLEDYPQFKDERLKGNLYILTNKDTCSGSEAVIANAELVNREKVITIGTNTRGGYDSCRVHYYILPNSKIIFGLCDTNVSDTVALTKNPSWHGDTNGFYPDYWCDSDNLLNTLVQLTGDNELLDALSGLDKGLLN